MTTKEEVVKTIDEALGTPPLPDENQELKIPIRVVMPKGFLANLSEVLREQNKKLAEGNYTKEYVAEIVSGNAKALEVLSRMEQAIKDSRVDKIEVTNFPEQKEFKIPEIAEMLNQIKVLNERIEKLSTSGVIRAIETVAFDTNVSATVIPGVPGKYIKVYSAKVVVSDDMRVYWSDGGEKDIEGAQAFVKRGGYTESIAPPAYLFSTSQGKSLDIGIISNTNGYAAGRLSYWVE